MWEIKANIFLHTYRNWFSETGQALAYTFPWKPQHTITKVKNVLVNTWHLLFYLKGSIRKIQVWPSLMAFYGFWKKAILSHVLSVSPAGWLSNLIIKLSFREIFVKSKLLAHMVLGITIYRSSSNTQELLIELPEILKVVLSH